MRSLVRARLLREYPYAENTAHLLGYVARINEQELQEIDVSNYRGTSHIGKNGVEKTYESALHGAVGYEQIEINAAGRRVRGRARGGGRRGPPQGAHAPQTPRFPRASRRRRAWTSACTRRRPSMPSKRLRRSRVTGASSTLLSSQRARG